MSRIVCSLLVFFTSVALLSPLLLGQTTSTEVTGIVTDSSGLPIFKADVTLTRIDTGDARHETTNQQGIYVFPLIDPSTYRLDVKAEGFKTTTVNKINVLFQQRARVDVTLEVGQLTQTVEVTAEARLLNTEDAAVGQSLEQKRVVELPVGYRNIGFLAVTMPGVSFGTQMGATGAGARTSPAGATTDLIAYGQPSQTQGVSLDGVDVKEPRYARLTLQPSIDAIEEFKVQTATYSAEYGFSGGAQIQISMKSGTNALHGSVYEFLRNSALDATDYFLNYNLAAGATPNKKNALHRNVYGVYLGGPVMIPKLYDGKNRTFFSFNYEGRRELTDTVTTGWYPTDAMRGGDFSSLLKRPSGAVTIYDPLTGTPFPNNIIPASRINAGAQNLLKYFPEPQFQQADPLAYTNRVNIANTASQSAWFMRFDHNFTSKDRAFFRLAWDHQDWAVPTINPNFGETYFNNPKSLALAWTHIVTPNILNEFRYGFLDTQTQDQNRRSNSNFDENSLGIGTFVVNAPGGTRPLNSLENRIPPMAGLGAPFGDIYGLGVDSSMVYDLANHVSIINGKHAFKMGGEFHRSAMTRKAANYPGGQVNFSTIESGNGFSSLLLGYPDTVETPEGYPLTIPIQNLWALYFLDDWKITPRLTVNLGLRYDHIGIPYDRGGYWRTISFSQLNTTPAGAQVPTIVPTVLGSTAAVPLWSNNQGMFMPRLGIAYRMGKWVFRSGTGWFDNSAHFNVYTTFNLMPPFSAGQQFNAITTTVTGGTRMFTPGSFILSLGPNLFTSPNAVKGAEMLFSVQGDRKNDNHWQWSTDIQRELPLGTALTISYVGSKTSNASGIMGYWNAAQPSSNTNFQSRRPVQWVYDPLQNPVYAQAGTIQMIVSGLNNYYEGATVSLDKRYSNGLAFGINYTYSLANGQSSGPQDSPVGENPQNWADGKAALPFNQRNRTIANFVYEIPYRRDGKGVLGFVLGGWQAGGIATIASGLPYSITQGDDINSGKSQDGGQIRPDVVGSPIPANQSITQWYNPAAFQRVTCNIPNRPDLCHWGNAGPNILTLPAARNLDFSMTKNFHPTEWMRIDFRAEAFNAFNHPWFGAPTGIGFVNNTSITPNAPNEGQILSLTAPMRTLQLGLKVLW